MGGLGGLPTLEQPDELLPGRVLSFFSTGNIWKQVWPVSETILTSFLGFAVRQSSCDSSDVPLLVWDQISAKTLLATSLGMVNRPLWLVRYMSLSRLVLKAS